MIYLVPTRGRPRNAEALIKAWHTQSMSRNTSLHFLVDQDDTELPNYRRLLYDASHEYAWLSWCVHPGSGMVNALNYGANLPPVFGNSVIGFMGDDHRPVTQGWDSMIADALKERPGIVYGNDLIQGPRLPTQVAMSLKIVHALGFMAPPGLKHLYVDNYWLALGQGIERLTYLPDCIIEHQHPIAGKAKWDDVYRATNDGAVYAHDGEYFQRYVAEGRMDADVAKVRAALL